MTEALKMIISLVCLIIISACSPGDSNGTNRNGGQNKNGSNDKTSQPATCEQAWNLSVQSQHLGRVQQHENKSYSIISARRTLVSHSKIKETIKENDGTKITKLIETENIKPTIGRSNHEETYTRNEFLDVCKMNQNQPNEPNHDIQTRIIGKENISVKAGTFLTSHIESIINKTTNGMTSESKSDSWISDEYSGLVVKSQSHTVNRINGNSFESEFESELIYFKN